MIDINELAREIHDQNVKAGWWDGKQCIYTKLQLVSTEIAEATEAERKDLMDSHLPHRKGGEVELADALIRVLDLGGCMGWSHTGDNIATMSHYGSKSIAEHHLWINIDLANLSKIMLRDGTVDIFMRHGSCVNQYDAANFEYTFLINGILCTAKQAGYDIWGALSEKLEYNRKRLDHKRSERAKTGGKKF